MEQTLENPNPGSWEYDGDPRYAPGRGGPTGGMPGDELDAPADDPGPRGVWGLWLRLTGPGGAPPA